MAKAQCLVFNEYAKNLSRGLYIVSCRASYNLIAEQMRAWSDQVKQSMIELLSVLSYSEKSLDSKMCTPCFPVFWCSVANNDFASFCDMMIIEDVLTKHAVTLANEIL